MRRQQTKRLSHHFCVSPPNHQSRINTLKREQDLSEKMICTG
jgi:hypothetical protein